MKLAMMKSKIWFRDYSLIRLMIILAVWPFFMFHCLVIFWLIKWSFVWIVVLLSSALLSNKMCSNKKVSVFYFNSFYHKNQMMTILRTPPDCLNEETIIASLTDSVMIDESMMILLIIELSIKLGPSSWIFFFPFSLD